MGLFTRKKDILCIDIGFRNIKVVDISLLKDDIVQINNYGIASTPRECIRNGHIKDIEKMSFIIGRVITDNDIKTKDTKIVMSGTHISSRLFMIKILSGQDLEYAIKEKLLNFMPGKGMENYEVRHKVLEKVDQKGVIYYKVFVTVILKSILKGYFDLVQNLKLNCISVDVPANSIDKIFKRKLVVSEMNANKSQHFNLASDEAFAVIDFGSETTIVNILNNKSVEFNNPILRGGSNIDENIARASLRKLSDAEAIKQKYGLHLPETFVYKERIAIQDGVLSIVNDMVEQMYRSFEFYQIRNNGPKISKVFIIGGTSQMKGLAEYIEEMLNIPVIPIGLLNFHNVIVDKDLDNERINYLINGTGIALD